MEVGGLEKGGINIQAQHSQHFTASPVTGMLVEAVFKLSSLRGDVTRGLSWEAGLGQCGRAGRPWSCWESRLKEQWVNLLLAPIAVTWTHTAGGLLRLFSKRGLGARTTTGRIQGHNSGNEAEKLHLRSDLGVTVGAHSWEPEAAPA